MAITAKPVAPVINSGASHYPTHLWLLDEGSGTNLDDKGSGTPADMTIIGSNVVWEADGTHGNILKANVGNVDSYADVNSGLGATVSVGIMLMFRTGPVNPAAAYVLGGMGRVSGSGIHATSRISSTGRFEIAASNNVDPAISTQYSSTDYADGVDHMHFFKIADDQFAHSIDGAVLDVDLDPTVFDWATAAYTRFGIFASVRPTPTQYAPGSSTDPCRLIAAAAWVDNYAAWDNSWIAALWNGGDPWLALGAGGGGGVTKKYHTFMRNSE